MESLLHLMLIGMASNLDNLGVGVAYGARRIRISAGPNLMMAMIAFLFSLISGWAGVFVGRFVGEFTAKAIGALLLAGIGVWVLASQWRTGTEHPQITQQPPPSVLEVWQAPERADADQSGTISVNESIVLGAAVGANCLANGFAAGLWRLPAVEVALSNALFSLLTLWGGDFLGRRYAANWLGRYATMIAGGLLILLGLRELL